MNALSKNGYTWEDFVIAPVIIDNVKDYLHFTLTGSVERFCELFLQHRFFKIFALFLIGFYLGRNEIIYKLEEYFPVFKKFLMVTMPIALLLSVLYAFESVNNQPFGWLVHSIIYIFSVYPLSFAYMSGLVLLYYKFKDFPLWKFFATAGRMSLTIYLAQSFFAIFIFYGFGLALGGKVELWQSILIAVAVYCVEVLLATLWFKRFKRGPLEAIWRKASN